MGDRRRRLRRRRDGIEAGVEAVGVNNNNDDCDDAAAMAIMALSTELLGRHQRTVSTSPVDGIRAGTNGNDNDSDSSASTSSTNSSSNSNNFKSHDTSDDDENEHHSNCDTATDDGLSDYERLRLRNIQRNEMRLASLGLLRIDEQSNKTAGAATASTSFNKKRKSTSLAPSLPPQPRRSLPRRRCSNHQYPYNECESDEESSVMPSPIPIIRTLRPQSHQKVLDEQHLKIYMRTRRMRRGRPRREEYQYKCEEQCVTCGGGWMFDNSIRKDDDGDGNFENIGNNDDNDDVDSHDEDNSVDEHDQDEDIEERTRLIRCKDCRGAFHLECMLAHGKEPCESDEVPIGGGDDARSDASDSCAHADTSLIEPSSRISTRDPKRCHQCEAKRKEEHLHQKQTDHLLPTTTTTTCALTLLEATIENRVVVVRLSIDPVLEANAGGRDITCTVTLHGQPSSDSGGFQSNPQQDNFGGDDDNKPVLVANVDGKDITCFVTLYGQGSSKSGRFQSHPLEDNFDDDNEKATNGFILPNDAHKIQQLIDKALSYSANARIQATSCISLREYITTEDVAATVGRLGGIRMLLNSLRNHLDRPNIQAEAMCTLAEIYRVCPRLNKLETMHRGGCLDLAILAMERHPYHAKVQQMACRIFRALSHDTKFCSKLKSKKVVSAVVDSIRRNPKKRDVMEEGSMFLQNMMGFLSETSINSILKLKFRSDDNLPGLIPTVLASIKTNRSDSNLVVTLFGLLLNVSRTSKGSAVLRASSIDSLMIDTIQEHFDTPQLHEMAFAVLRNILLVDECETNATLKSSDLIKLALNSSTKHPCNGELQENVCRLLVVLTSQSNDEVRRLVQGKRCRRILTLASENFPDSCQEVVRLLLRSN